MRHARLVWSGGLLALAVLLVPAGAVTAQADKPEKPAAPAATGETGESSKKPAKPAAEGHSFQEITPQLEKSVNEGLAYLAKSQKANGGFELKAGDEPHVGITAICGLAFLAHGELPGRGKYGKNVQRGLDYILANKQASGLLASKNVSHGPMYGHGFATLFLAEVYGSVRGDAVRDALVKAVRLIVKSQNDEGGWRYYPDGKYADLSVTICQIKALRAARMAGIDVPKQTVDRAIQYVKDLQNSDGGFRYKLVPGSSLFPRSASGVASLYYAGVYKSEVIEAGLEYLHKQVRYGRDMDYYAYYGHYYCSQAMFIAGGKHWAKYFPYIRGYLIKNQRSNGEWDSRFGSNYATGMSLIILQMPYRMMPIFQR